MRLRRLISFMTRRKPRSRSRAITVETCEPRMLLANTGVLQGVVTIGGTSQGLAGAIVRLQSLPDETVLQTVTTGTNGVYQFQGLAPGNYRIVETPPAGYASNQTHTNSPLTPILAQTPSSIDVQLGDFSQLVVDYPTRNKENLSVTNDSHTQESSVGQLNITVAVPDINHTTALFASFCVDFFRDIHVNDADLPYSADILSDALAADAHVSNPENAGAIAYLYNQIGSKWSTSVGQYVPVEKAAGLQLAMWELEYEETGDYNVLTGTSRVNGLNAQSQVVVEAQAFLAQAETYMSLDPNLQHELALYLNGLATDNRATGSQGVIAPMSLDFTNEAVRTPSIALRKLTNGVHDTNPNGANLVRVAEGGALTWTYLVINPGDVSFARADVVVTDDQPGVTPAAEVSGGFVVGDTNQNNMFDPGETWTYTATGTAVDLVLNSQGYTVVPGGDPNGTGNTQPVYENTATVTITNTDLKATDISHYANPADPSITLQKLTNGVHDINPNGANLVRVAAGGAVTWTYNVTNDGNVSFARNNVVVTDDQPGVTPAAKLSGGFVVGDTNQNNMFDPGETWTYTATGTAVDLLLNSQGYTVVPGADPNSTGNTQPVYENTGTVTITNTSLTDTDISHYANTADPAIALVKLTNGVHDTNPNGTNVVILDAGDAVTWTYNVTSGGNVSFARANVVVTDNQPGVTPAAKLSGGFVVGDTNQNNKLDPGETWTFTATGTAVDLEVNAPGYITVPGMDPNNTGNTQPVYQNTGTVTISSTTLIATDLSHYANPPSSPADLPSTLAGTVFEECDDNGVQNAGETGIPGVTVYLTGFNTGGQLVNMVTTTNSLGQYSFSVTDPGTYVVTIAAPSGFIEGKTTAGTAGGVANGSSIMSITLPAGTDATGYNFAFLHPSALSGYVYFDLNHNGVMDGPDFGIAHVEMTLIGTNDRGQSINMVTTTNDHGFYSFNNLRPGTYEIVRAHPEIFVDYRNNAGSLGGTVGKNSISDITVPPCKSGTNYNFGELQQKTCNLRNLAISVGNMYAKFQRQYQNNPIKFARQNPKLAPYLAQGKVPFGVIPFPQAKLASYWVPDLGSKVINLKQVYGSTNKAVTPAIHNQGRVKALARTLSHAK